MIKGINRNMIVVRPGKRSGFEAVLFIPRRESRGREDLLREANRIISDSVAWKKRRVQPSAWQKLLWAFGGLLVGAGLAVAVCLLLLL